MFRALSLAVPWERDYGRIHAVPTFALSSRVYPFSPARS